MIKSDPDPQENTPVIDKSQLNTVTPATTFSAPQSPKKGFHISPPIILMVVLFVAAVVGGLFAYQNFSKTNQSNITTGDESLAWAPLDVQATCSGVRVIGHVEPTSYKYNFTFVLSATGRSGSVSHVFESKPVSGGHKIDADATWASFGSEGAAFASLIKTRDTLNWNVVVDYTLNNSPQQERHSGTVKINDTSCSLTSSPTPTASPAASASATPTSRPTATPVASPSVTPSPSPTVRPTATPTSVPTDPPVGGPSSTPTPSPTATPVPTVTASPTPTTTTTTTTSNQTPSPTQPTAVANSNAEQLPTAGVPYGVVMMIFGVLSLAIAGTLSLSRKRF